MLRITTKSQLFQFEGNLYEQVDGVGMGSPLGPLIANAFVCKIEKQLEKENKMPFFCKRYVDDTISAMVDVKIASEFLMTLNSSHPSIGFTMGLEENGRLPFLLILLHYHSHIDTRCSRLCGGFFTRNVNASKGIFSTTLSRRTCAVYHPPFH